MEPAEVKSFHYPPAVFVLTASSVDDSDDCNDQRYDVSPGCISPNSAELCERKLSADAVLTSNPKRSDEDELSVPGSSQLITRSWSEFTLSSAARKCLNSGSSSNTSLNAARVDALRRKSHVGNSPCGVQVHQTHVTAFAQFRVRTGA